LLEPLVQFLDRRRCVEGADGREWDGLCSVGALLGDEVVGDLPVTAGLRSELVEVSVELVDDVRGERNGDGARMDRVEHRSVAGNLGLRPVAWLGRLRDELLDPPFRSRDVLDRVRCFDALDQRLLDERFERGGMLTAERFLAPAADVDLAQLAPERGRDQVEMAAEIAEALRAEKVQGGSAGTMSFERKNP
jgi:hypothetical protein